MTNQLQETTFIPRDYDIFGGLDVDKKSMAAFPSREKRAVIEA